MENKIFPKLTLIYGISIPSTSRCTATMHFFKCDDKECCDINSSPFLFIILRV